MFDGWHASSSGSRVGRRCWTPIVLLLAAAVAGCGSVAVSVEQPVGARVELYQKAKWFGACGPDWGTGWDKVAAKTVEGGTPADLELDARNGWGESVTTCFPRQYRMCFDLSGVRTYPKTPTSVVEVRYGREVVPDKYQHIVQLWHEGRTLDVLTNLPPDVLADVLYNLGGNFRRLIFREVSPEARDKAAKDLKAMLDAGAAPSPQEIESWLKSFLTVEQLGQVCRWVRNGVSLGEVRWIPLAGEPKQQNPPPLTVSLPFSVLDLFLRVPDIRRTRVDLFEDVILRDLLVYRVESKVVNVNALKFYAEVKTFDTRYYTDRVVPAIDLVQDIGLVAGVSPNKQQMEELATYGMTRSEAGTREFVSPDGKVKVAPFGLRPPDDIRTDGATYKVGYGAEDSRETIRRGLEPVSLDKFPMTCVRSQIIGALLEGEMAYVIIWNNPHKKDPVRYLTTVVTTSPYGMARVWALRDGSPVCEARAAFESTDAPIGVLVSWVIKVLDQRALFFDLHKPVAVFAFGRRPLEPWADMPRPPLSNVKMMQELAPSEEAGK